MKTTLFSAVLVSLILTANSVFSNEKDNNIGTEINADLQIENQLECIESTDEVQATELKPLAQTKSTNSESSKEINRTFTVGANPHLQIENRYGNITIVKGQQKKIAINVTITVQSFSKDSKEWIKERMENIDIEFNQQGNSISAITKLNPINSQGRGRNNFSIDYLVIVPEDAYMNLQNKFGDIILNTDVQKDVKLTVEYGNLTAQNMAHADLNIAFGNFTIAQAEYIKLFAKYIDNGVVEKATSINMKSAFSDFKLENVKHLTVASKYDKYNMGNIENINIDLQYTSVNINQLQSSFTADKCQYSNVSIKNILPDFQSINIPSAAYSNFKFDLSAQHNFAADLYSSYGSVQLRKVIYDKKDLSEDNDAFHGIVGNKKNPQQTIQIRGKYSSIKL